MLYFLLEYLFMQNNFWNNLPRPFFIQAPMADVSDAAFRELIAKYSKPDVMYTEFVSADGLCSPGRDKLLVDFKYSAGEHPIVAQIFSSKPENIFVGAKLAKELGFDGVDINMGCPEKSICSQGSGAAMIKNPAVARACIRAAIEGASGLPVSVKTRLGLTKREELEVWLPELLAENLACVIIHARTKKEMSKVPADWAWVKRAVEIRNALGSKTLIVGNGDVASLEQARARIAETGCDGVMIGREMFGNPWLFNRGKTIAEVPLAQRLTVAIEHAKLFEKYFSGVKAFAIMKKHFKAYVNGFDGAKELRMKLMETETAAQVEQILQDYIKTLK